LNHVLHCRPDEETPELGKKKAKADKIAQKLAKKANLVAQQQLESSESVSWSVGGKKQLADRAKRFGSNETSSMIKIMIFM
jgi:hypothetical protein